MRLRTSGILTAALGWLAVTPAAWAFQPPTDQDKLGEKSMPFPVEIRVLRPEAKSVPAEAFSTLKNVEGISIKHDPRSGVVRLISGGRILDLPAIEDSKDLQGFVDRSLGYLASHPEIFGVTAEQVELRESALLLHPDVQFLKFDVWRNGLRIEDASVDFRYKKGTLLQVANLAFAEAPSDDRQRISGLDGIAAAISGAKVEELGESYRVVEAEGGYRLVRVVNFEAIDQDGTKWIVQLEAATGSPFEIRPTEFHLDGAAHGHVHARYYADPLEIAPYPELNLTYSGGRVTTDLEGHFFGAPDSAEPRIDGFSGARITINVQTGTPVRQTGGMVRDQWRVVYETTPGSSPWENKSLAQSMVYYHATRMVHRAKQYIESSWLERPLRANVNLSRTCNAHWDGSTINFYSAGGGCANTGLISDVVFHEWGHGLDANTGGIQDGAFSEGYGDIMSMIMTRSHILGIGFRTDGRPVRDLEPDRVYPRDRGGGVHNEGLIIGSTFWDLFKALRDAHGEDAAVDLVSRYALQMIFTAARYTEVYDALLVIDDDNADLSDGTPNYCIINKAFSDHGLAQADSACELAGVEGLELDDAVGGDGDGFLEPGEMVDLWLVARNTSSNALAGLTGTVSVESGDVAVVDADLAWDPIPARDVRRSANPAVLEISPDAECGSSIEAVIRLQADSRSAVVRHSFVLGRLDGSAQREVASGLPVAIRDYNTARATLQVEGDQWDQGTVVHSARLKFDITHTYVGDLTISLVAPDGTRKEVMKGSGSGDDIHFDEDVSELLAGLAGAGTWALEVYDNGFSDVGTLDSFELTLTPKRFVCD